MAQDDDTPFRSNVRVWRRDFAVLHRSMPDDEAHCLRALEEAPLSLAQLAERLLECPSSSGSPEPSAQRFAELLEVWTRDQLLVRAEAR